MILVVLSYKGLPLLSHSADMCIDFRSDLIIALDLFFLALHSSLSKD